MAYVNTLSDFAAAPGGCCADAKARIATTPAPTRPRPPFFRWREEWCVGIDALDRDRRALAAILNYIALRFAVPTSDAPGADLMSNERPGREPSALRYWLNALRGRAKEHFAREEALMRTTDYPDLVEHAGEHALMLAEYTALARDVVARGEEGLRMEDLEAMKHWFMGHVLDMDTRLGHYLRRNGISTLRLRSIQPIHGSQEPVQV